ncbi:MAG: leucine--tRNA ligase [Candidatus Rhabdochlamydia sp.]
MSNYPHQQIEQKWQKYWDDHQTFKAEVDLSKPKYYVLDMFPYPSGAGLHVGHVTGYTATDVITRYMRTKGYNVLHPMGWDSFGLPAEQYAIRTGTHPSITTEKNINTYRRQLKSLGLSYDWSREIATSDATYYKWTQWIFTHLFEQGLAYEAEMLVNYCPALGTVLANEEVEQGRSKEGGHLIERRPLKQWILKITAYADRLLQDLDLLDWPDSLKRLQTHWIGRSEGAKVQFALQNINETLSVFTTRPDTLFGVSFLVLAPEHPLVGQITSLEQHESVQTYLKTVQSKSDLERTDLSQEKTGVWTGSYALHPVTHNLIPIWIADYVLANYGTGAVMGVPGSDERDFAFATTFNLPILPVIISEGLTEEEMKETCVRSEGIICNSQFLDRLTPVEGKKVMIEWLEQHQKGERSVTYKLRDWLFSRQRYWGEPFPILHLEDGTIRALELDELPLIPPDLTDYKPSATGQSPLAKAREWVEVIDPKTGKKALRETNTMPQWAGSCWYYLRFCDPHNDQKPFDPEKESYWMPVDLYVGGVEHAVLHLLYARFWHKVLYDCGFVSTPEPFQKLRNQGLLTSRSYKLPLGGYLPEDEVVEREGKFFEKTTGVLLESQVEKMSKSKLNGVTPDEMVEEYGADSLRLYELFMGPFDQEKVWNNDAIQGCFRFLNRFYNLVTSEKIKDQEGAEAALKLSYRLAFHVEKDLSSMAFNTAIAKMMEFINTFSQLSFYPKQAVKMAVQVLYPFAPHIAEEMWHLLGESQSLTYAAYPIIDETYLIDHTALYVIQVNGKLRGKWELPRDKTEDEIKELIQKEPQIMKHIVGTIKKTVFVPNKLLNVVTDV